jgi:ribonuclease HI
MPDMPNKLLLYFDGLCEPVNPGGVACYGWAIMYYEDDGEWHVWACESGFIEEGPAATNNVAEWSALKFALYYLVRNQWTGKLTIKGDSNLVIEQLVGNWRCNGKRLIEFRDCCLNYLEELGLANIQRNKKGKITAVEHKFTAMWIPRDQNKRADALSNQAYENHTGKKVMPRKVACACGKTCVRFISQTERNPNRAFIKCECGQFTWLE